MKRAWGTLVLGALALAGSGCEDGLEFCTNRDDAGQCPDIPDFDANFDMDATPPASDGGTDARTDATTTDSAIGDASMDAQVPDAAAPTSYNIEEFCAALYGVAKAWQGKFDQCCLNSDTALDRSIFLLGALLYDDGYEDDAKESVGACVAKINASNGPKLTYNASAAVTCATKFASQFTPPPDSCGFALEMLEATNGHQARAIPQIPECRAAFGGKVGFAQTCTNEFECADGKRCIETQGAKACRDPLGVSLPCIETRDCADGLICQGTASGGRTCQPSSLPVEVSSNCLFSTECRTGLFCGPDSKCIAPGTFTICAQ